MKKSLCLTVEGFCFGVILGIAEQIDGLPIRPYLLPLERWVRGIGIRSLLSYRNVLGMQGITGAFSNASFCNDVGLYGDDSSQTTVATGQCHFKALAIGWIIRRLEVYA